MSPQRRTSPTEVDAQRARRRDELATDIATRLRRVCGHLPEEEFAALVQGIAAVTLKYEERDLTPPVDDSNPPPRGA